MPTEIIQWFPGHMAKTRRLIRENLKNVDFVIELLDARIPLSSRNPEIRSLTEGKPLLTLLNKSALADPTKTGKWASRYTDGGQYCIPFDCMTKKGLDRLMPTVREMMSEKLERYEDRGMSGRKLRAMVVGIPNVGKSSLINLLCGERKAKVENRPGVTLTPQWITTDRGLNLMDMPGVLWPRFDDRTVGENLAFTGAIKDDVVIPETLAVSLCGRLRRLYPSLFAGRYKLSIGDITDLSVTDEAVFEMIGKKRGFLISKGEIDTRRTADMLLDEFRAARIGCITLDVLPEGENEHADI